MIRSLVEKIENQEITLVQWLEGFIGILFIRFLFESLSSPTHTGIIPSDPYTLIHYSLFWTTLVLGLIIIVGFFSKNYLSAAKISLFGLPVIWIAPIFDFIISRGHGLKQSYVFDNGNKLIFDFFTFFGRTFTEGATYGIRIEMLVVLIGIGLYLWDINRNIYRSIFGVICVYIFGFFLINLPGIIYTLSHISEPIASNVKISTYFQNIVLRFTTQYTTGYCQ
jgi:hypothetical protein